MFPLFFRAEGRDPRRPAVKSLQLFAGKVVVHDAAVAEGQFEHAALTAELIFADGIEAERERAVLFGERMGEENTWPTTCKTASMKVDIDDLLAKAEEFYELNVNRLKFANPGKGQSVLDKFTSSTRPSGWPPAAATTT